MWPARLPPTTSSLLFPFLPLLSSPPPLPSPFSRESVTEDTLEAERLSGSKDNQSVNEDVAPPPESSELVKTKELLRVEREQKVG